MKAITLIMVLVFMAMPLNAYADAAKEKACANALNACIDYTKKEELDIQYAKQEIQELENQMVEDDNAHTRSSLLYMAGAFIAGGLLVRVLTK